MCAKKIFLYNELWQERTVRITTVFWFYSPYYKNIIFKKISFTESNFLNPFWLSLWTLFQKDCVCGNFLTIMSFSLYFFSNKGPF